MTQSDIVPGNVDSEPRYVTDDGRVIYRASSLGMCDRIFAALAHGYESAAKPEWFQEVLDEGARMEEVIREQWIAGGEGREVVDIGRRLEMEILDGVWVVGHIDGLTPEISEKYSKFPDTPNLFEAKKFRDSTWQKFRTQGVECMPYYPMQTAFYMHALQEADQREYGMVFVGGRYDPDEDTITEVYHHRYQQPPVPLLAIRKRIAKLEALCNEGTHPADVPCMVPGMYPCPMFYLHDTDAPEPPERPPDDTVTILLEEYASFADEFGEITAKYKTMEKNVKRIKEGIDGWLKASGVDDGGIVRVEVDGVTYELKAKDVYRKGYSVDPTTYTLTTIGKVNKLTGKRETPKRSPRQATGSTPHAPKGDDVTADAKPPLTRRKVAPK